MVKSLVGLQRINNIPSLISRGNEGAPSASYFLTTSWFSFRYCPVNIRCYYARTALSCEETVHLHVAAYSRYSSANTFPMGFKLQSTMLRLERAWVYWLDRRPKPNRCVKHNRTVCYAAAVGETNCKVPLWEDRKQ